MDLPQRKGVATGADKLVGVLCGEGGRGYVCRDGVPMAPMMKARRALHPAGHRGGGD